jgi:hypothetical protein
LILAAFLFASSSGKNKKNALPWGSKGPIRPSIQIFFHQNLLIWQNHLFLRPIKKSKKLKMKKFLAIAAIALFMVACNDAKKEETTVTTTDSVTTTESTTMSNMADSANKMMDKMGDSANKMMDKMGDSAAKMMDKAAEKMEEKKH